MSDQNVLSKSELRDTLRTSRDEVVGIVRSLSAEGARLATSHPPPDRQGSSSVGHPALGSSLVPTQAHAG
jgi:hypothetical protein